MSSYYAWIVKITFKPVYILHNNVKVLLSLSGGFFIASKIVADSTKMISHFISFILAGLPPFIRQFSPKQEAETEVEMSKDVKTGSM